MAAEQRNCSGCGELFLATNHGRVGRLPKWCERCRIGTRATCACGTEFVRRNAGQSRCALGCRGAALRTCEACGKSFRKKKSGRNAGRACSRECGWAVMRMDGARRREQRGEHGPQFSVVAFKTCGICRRWFSVRGNGAQRRLCSQACREQNWRRKSREIYREKRSRIDWTATYRCTICGSQFTPGWRTVSVECCSAACFRRRANRKLKRTHGNHRRRARALGRQYEPIKKEKVFERDGWTCALCGKKCRKRLRKGEHWNPDLATLDHIIPLSWPDGHHLWSNVQCACWDCNSKKSANEARGQLSLLPEVA